MGAFAPELILEAEAVEHRKMFVAFGRERTRAMFHFEVARHDNEVLAATLKSMLRSVSPCKLLLAGANGALGSAVCSSQ